MVFQNGLFTVESWVFVTSYNSGPDSAGFFNIIYESNVNKLKKDN
jgi:hypothetical protein